MEQPIYMDNRASQAELELPRIPSPLTESGLHCRFWKVERQRAAAEADPQTDAQFTVSASYLIMKRLLDIIVSFCLLLILMPLLVCVALCISLESRGPIIYRRRVLAWQEWDPSLGPGALKTFNAYKLRTMIPDADEYLTRNPHLFTAYQKDWKLPNDPRITRLGGCLRSWSIDELPQLVNVLLGQMTLVGPRMITAPELSRYGEDAPTLLRVKPGLTGLWQVSGRQELSYEERVRLDMAYIASRSLWLDVQILLRTIRCVLLRQGAY